MISLRAADLYLDQHILVLPVAYMDRGEEIIDAYFDKERIRVTAGGETRFDSVKNALKLVTEESIVFVHDAVRCLISKDLVRRCGDMALQTGSAIPIVFAKDSIRMVDEENSEPVDRTKIGPACAPAPGKNRTKPRAACLTVPSRLAAYTRL